MYVNIIEHQQPDGMNQRHVITYCLVNSEKDLMLEKTSNTPSELDDKVIFSSLIDFSILKKYREFNDELKLNSISRIIEILDRNNFEALWEMTAKLMIEGANMKAPQKMIGGMMFDMGSSSISHPHLIASPNILSAYNSVTRKMSLTIEELDEIGKMTSYLRFSEFMKAFAIIGYEIAKEEWIPLYPEKHLSALTV